MGKENMEKLPLTFKGLMIWLQCQLLRIILEKSYIIKTKFKG